MQTTRYRLFVGVITSKAVPAISIMGLASFSADKLCLVPLRHHYNDCRNSFRCSPDGAIHDVTPSVPGGLLPRNHRVSAFPTDNRPSPKMYLRAKRQKTSTACERCDKRKLGVCHSP